MVRTNSALLGLAESRRSRLRATLIDEIRSLSLGLNGDNLFFQFVNTCYEKCEIIFPTSANEERSLATAGWRRLCPDGLFFFGTSLAASRRRPKAFAFRRSMAACGCRTDVSTSVQE